MNEDRIPNLPYYDTSGIERSIIGCCFIDSIALDELIEFGVESWWFRSSANKTIWQTLVKLKDRSDAIDIVTATLELEQCGELSKLPGGPAYVAECVNNFGVATSEHAVHYAKEFRKYVKLRMIDGFSTKLKTVVTQTPQEPEEVLSYIKNNVEQIEQMTEDAPETLSTLYHQVYAEMTRFDRAPPIKTGFDKIDNIVGGLYPQELTVLAGESGIGKTAFLTCILRNVNKKEYPVALFSLEMGGMILAMRVLSASARIQLKDIREGTIPVNKMYEAIQKHGSETFYIKTNCWSIQEIEAATRVMVRTKGVKLVGIDYIQLVEGNNLRGRNREQEISGIARSCKKLAKDCGIHIIALSQLDDSWDGKPTGRNIRESKAVKHHSDNVFIIYKPKDYDGRVVKCIIDKGRNNATGEVTFGVIGGFTEFVNDPRDVSFYDERNYTNGE